jgi:hypothetical protein
VTSQGVERFGHHNVVAATMRPASGMRGGMSRSRRECGKVMHSRLRLVLALAVLAAVAAGTTGEASTPGEPPAAQTTSGGVVAGHVTARPFAVAQTRPNGASAGYDCPVGRLCLYAGPNFGYPRAQLGSCGITELAAWGWQRRTEAVDNELAVNPFGSRQARAGVAAFVQRSGSADSSDDLRLLLSLDQDHRTMADLGAERNVTDYVYPLLRLTRMRRLRFASPGPATQAHRRPWSPSDDR